MRRARALDDEPAAQSPPGPIFALSKWEDWRTQLSVSVVPPGIEDLKQVAAGGGVVVLCTGNPNYIIRWNVGEGTSQLVELRFKSPHKLKRSFVDPTGCHIIITAMGSSGAVTMYAHRDKAEAKELTKLKGIEVASVAWDPENPPSDSTGTVLFGSVDGQVCEVIIEDRREKKCVAVYKMADSVSITGLRYDRVPSSDGSPPKLFVLAATACPTRCYQFMGGPTFTDLFSSLKNLYYNEIRGVDVENVQLVVYSPPTSTFSTGGGVEWRPSRPQEFGLLTGFGVYFGRLSFKPKGASDKVVAGERMLSYPAATVAASGAASSQPEIPVAISMTEFHMLLLYPSKLLAVSKLTQEIVFEQGFKERFGEMRGMVTDAGPPGTAYPLIWLFSSRGVYQLNIHEEDRDMWKSYLQLARSKGGKLFDTALSFCKSTEQVEEVRRTQADFLFRQNDLEGAARSYAATRVPFEEVALKFVNADEKRALKLFIGLRLEAFKPEDKLQRTVLCTWLTEMLLEEVVRCNNLPATGTARLDSDAAEQAVREFHEFLSKQAAFLDPPTTIHLISSYDRMDDVLFFCGIIKDFERIVSYHVQNKDVPAALSVLSLKEIPEDNAAEMFYKYTPALVQLDVVLTVKAWRRCKFLDPAKLIPSLVRYSSRTLGASVGSHATPARTDEQDAIISYLSLVIRRGKQKSTAVYNYLLSLYADRGDVDGLTALIEDQCAQAQPLLDLNFALRVCSNRNQHKACVLLYKSLRMYDEALDAALKVGLDSAEEVANMPDLDESLKKSLWMKLLRNAIQSSPDISIALDRLSSCDVLKIDDVLALFPDFTTIETFKAQISKSLEDSSKKLQELRDDMKDFTDSAERIRQDIKTLRYRCGVVKTAQACEFCSEQLLQADFYLFPCMHGFHSACLVNEVITHFGPAQAARVRQLQKDLRSIPSVPIGHPTSSGTSAAPGEDPNSAAYLQSELDEAVASECPLCGEAMIDSVAAPFLDDGEHVGSEWDI